MWTPDQRKRMIALRAAQDVVIPLAADKPAIINECVAIIREWSPDKNVVGDIRLYRGIPYKCVQAHDSTSNPGWTPDTVPALWMQYHGTSVETARPYLQPLGAHDAYQVDEYCIESGKAYRCKKNATVNPPSQFNLSMRRRTESI